MTEVHPVAALFPMLAEDELRELAEDIKQRGLLHPIVLDAQGRVLDGRNRLAACRMADIEPTFTTYDGDDPDGYALAVNIARRHLTTGARAVIAAKAARLNGVSYKSVTDDQAKLPKTRLAEASLVLDWSANGDLANEVTRWCAHLACGCTVHYPRGVPVRTRDATWCGYHRRYTRVRSIARTRKPLTSTNT